MSNLKNFYNEVKVKNEGTFKPIVLKDGFYQMEILKIMEPKQDKNGGRYYKFHVLVKTTEGVTKIFSQPVYADGPYAENGLKFTVSLIQTLQKTYPNDLNMQKIINVVEESVMEGNEFIDFVFNEMGFCLAGLSFNANLKTKESGQYTNYTIYPSLR